MSTNSLPRVFVSFERICLENFPGRGFNHYLLTRDKARQMIADARREKRLQGVSDKDYFAPWPEGEPGEGIAEELCEALTRHCRIPFTMADFELKDMKEAIKTIFPVQLVEVTKGSVLLVITGSYLTGGRGIDVTFKLAPESIRFDLFVDSEENLKISEADLAKTEMSLRSLADQERIAGIVSDARNLERLLDSGAKEMAEIIGEMGMEFPREHQIPKPLKQKKKKGKRGRL